MAGTGHRLILLNACQGRDRLESLAFHPGHAMPPAKPRADSLGKRLADFADAQLAQAAQCLSLPDQDRHEGIHEARKCLRRTRSALALGGNALGPHTARLDRDLQRLCRGLSRLRDAHAVVETLERLLAEAAPAAIPHLQSALALAHAQRDTQLAQALSSDPQFRRRCQRLQRARQQLAQLDWNGVEDDVVTRAFRRSERRVRKAGKRVDRHPERPLAWHAYRRRLRRLRQQQHLLNQVEPALCQPLEKEIKQHAVALGQAQDYALLLRRCGRRSPFPQALRNVLRPIARQRLQQARAALHP